MLSLTDDEGAGNLVGACRERLWTGAGNDHRTRWHGAAVLHGLSPPDVNDWRARGQYDVRAQDRLLPNVNTLHHNAPRSDEATVFNNDWRGLQGLQHPPMPTPPLK